MSSEERYHTTGMRLLGLVYIVVVALFLGLTVAIYAGTFSNDPEVTLHADHIGNQMQPDADVKLRGITVGSVKSIASDGGNAKLVLAMNPALLDRIPKNVSASLLPKTLFGERYVNLIMPASPSGRLGGGDEITQDRSARTIEMERVLNDLLPLLRAVQPEKLAEMLNTLATALQGRGKPLGDTLTQIGQFVGDLNPQLPEIKQDISRFASVADTYGQAAPDFIQALNDFTVTSKTIVDQRNALLTLYQAVTTASGSLTDFLNANKSNIISLSDTSRQTLELLAKYAPEYACLLGAVAGFKDRVDKAFTKDGPGLSVNLQVFQARGKYTPGGDDPAYTYTQGPRCFGFDAPAFTPVNVGSLANSPSEQQMLSTMLAPAMNVPPKDVPAWSSLLVGPLYRGQEVTVK